HFAKSEAVTIISHSSLIREMMMSAFRELHVLKLLNSLSAVISPSSSNNSDSKNLINSGSSSNFFIYKCNEYQLMLLSIRLNFILPFTIDMYLTNNFIFFSCIFFLESKHMTKTTITSTMISVPNVNQIQNSILKRWIPKKIIATIDKNSQMNFNY